MIPTQLPTDVEPALTLLGDCHEFNALPPSLEDSAPPPLWACAGPTSRASGRGSIVQHGCYSAATRHYCHCPCTCPTHHPGSPPPWCSPPGSTACAGLTIPGSGRRWAAHQPQARDPPPDHWPAGWYMARLRPRPALLAGCASSITPAGSTRLRPKLLAKMAVRQPDSIDSLDGITISGRLDKILPASHLHAEHSLNVIMVHAPEDAPGVCLWLLPFLPQEDGGVLCLSLLRFYSAGVAAGSRRPLKGVLRGCALIQVCDAVGPAG